MKKLTNAGSAALLLASVAFVAALGGVLLEPIGYFIHDIVYGKDVGVFSGRSWYTFFTGYDKHIIIFLVSLAALCICISARRQRRIGAEAGALLSFASFGTLIASITTVASGSEGGTLEYTWATVLVPGLEEEMVQADRVMAVLYYVLPITASGLMLILGLILLVRAEVSSFFVACPTNEGILSSSSTKEAAELIEKAEKKAEYAILNENAEIPAAEGLTVPEPAEEPEQEAVSQPEAEQVSGTKEKHKKLKKPKK